TIVTTLRAVEQLRERRSILDSISADDLRHAALVLDYLVVLGLVVRPAASDDAPGEPANGDRIEPFPVEGPWLAERICVIGDGPLATALAAGLREAQAPVQCWSAAEEPAPASPPSEVRVVYGADPVVVSASQGPADAAPRASSGLPATELAVVALESA